MLPQVQYLVFVASTCVLLFNNVVSCVQIDGNILNQDNLSNPTKSTSHGHSDLHKLLSIYDEFSEYWQSTQSFENGNYVVKWTIVNRDSIDLLIQITDTEAPPNWIGFGISEHGSILGSDFVTVKYDRFSSNAVISDCWIPWSAYPLTSSPTPYPAIDSQQDWILKSVIANSSTLTVVLFRLLDTSDNQDRPFSNGSLPIIYAWGANPSLGYDGSKVGHTRISFQEDAISLSKRFAVPSDADGVINVDFSPSWTSLEGSKTSYICQLIDLQSYIQSTEHHVVAFESLFDTTPGGPFIHHTNVRGCRADAIDFILSDGMSFDQPRSCSMKLIEMSSQCPLLIGGTASIQASVAYPNTAGFRIGGAVGSSIRYLVAEVHLSNPSAFKNIVVSKILKLHTASNLRTHDIGSMAIGDMLLKSPRLPAATAFTTSEHSCTTQCSSKFSGPINFFVTFLHAHIMARELWVSQVTYDSITGASSTTVKDHREFWDFSSQSIVLHNPPWVVTPGDQINLHCVFDTSKLSGTTRFGMNSWDEMCMMIVMYYPAANAFPYCASEPSTGQSICGPDVSDLMPDVNPRPDGDSTRPRSVKPFGMSALETYAPSTRAPSRPSSGPTRRPTRIPSRLPTRSPSMKPTRAPSRIPSKAPTRCPTVVTRSPTRRPSLSPSRLPSRQPSAHPTRSPTRIPSARPSYVPTTPPSRFPTRSPSLSPSRSPSRYPSRFPTRSPTRSPSRSPTRSPSRRPSTAPSRRPTQRPSRLPTRTPSRTPTKTPAT